MFFIYLVGGFNPSDKYESQLGSWNSQYMESHKNHVPNHQPVMFPLLFGHRTPIEFTLPKKGSHKFKCHLGHPAARAPGHPGHLPERKPVPLLGLIKHDETCYNMFICNLNGYILTLWNTMINTNAFVIFLIIIFVWLMMAWLWLFAMILMA